jgi:hypothetical protein
VQKSAAREVQPKETAPQPQPVAPQDSDNAISLGDIEATKSLLERVGADSLRKLIDVLTR